MENTKITLINGTEVHLYDIKDIARESLFRNTLSFTDISNFKYNVNLKGVTTITSPLGKTQTIGQFCYPNGDETDTLGFNMLKTHKIHHFKNLNAYAVSAAIIDLICPDILIFNITDISKCYTIDWPDFDHYAKYNQFNGYERQRFISVSVLKEVD